MFNVPRGHYLLVHDAVRRVVGKEAALSAFVKQKKPFQCDMLVNSHMTDPDLELKYTNKYFKGELDIVNGRYTPPAADKKEFEELRDPIEDLNRSPYNTKLKLPISPHVEEFAYKLQHELGTCTVVPRRHHVEVIFQDRSSLTLALGAAKEAIGNLNKGEEINTERDAHRRPRLRISLGYDEEMFKASCDLLISLSARRLEANMFNFVRRSFLVDSNPEMYNAFEKANGDYRAVLPPTTFWLAHCYDFCKANPGVTSYMSVTPTVTHVFSSYTDSVPFLNPFCDGEDLNTMDCVRWLVAGYNSSKALDEAFLELKLGDERGKDLSLEDVDEEENNESPNVARVNTETK